MLERLGRFSTAKGRALALAALASGLGAGLVWLFALGLIVGELAARLDGCASEAGWAPVLALLACRALLEVAASLARHLAGFQVVERVKSDIVSKLKTLRMGFYSKERLGELANIIHHDTDTLEGVVGHLVARTAAESLLAAAALAWLISVDPLLALITAAPLPPALLVLARDHRRNLGLQRSAGDAGADMAGLFAEYVRGLPTVKAYSENDAFLGRLSAAIGRFGRRASVLAAGLAGTVFKYELLLGASTALMAAGGAWALADGRLFVEDLVLFVIVVPTLQSPFSAFEALWLDHLRVTDAFRRVEGLLEAPAAPAPAPAAFPTRLDISFEGVDFGYEPGRPALRGVSLSIAHGGLTALVGPSGSGKTTVVNLLLRFWDPDRGTIRIGGIDARELGPDDLLAITGLVTQEAHLFSGTIRENIALGRSGASDSEIEAAARLALIHDHVASLPMGYETALGENGAGLSGGERRRVTIARAFLRNPPLLVLDEASSGLDPINEAALQRSLSRLARGRTVLVVAHRLQSIRRADRIICLDRGRVAEIGTHDGLVALGGLYARLWAAQEAAKRWRLGGPREEG